MAGRPELIALLRAEIERDGPIPFRRFMEAALYHPEHGYYRRAGGPEIGRRGDFYTNVSVGALFGRALALQFAEMWERLGRPAEIVLIEQGAHHGQFLRDVLEAARAENPAFFAALRVAVREPAPALRERQRETLAPFADKASWFEDGASFPAAIFFSNELPDAFPVDRIVWDGAGWRESRVGWRDGAFAWKDGPPYAAPELPTDLPSCYATEVSPRAREWIAGVAGLFDTGYVVTVDYGYPAPLYYAPERSAGTLLAYRDHRSTSEVLDHAGEQDLTAHVDFTALARAGEAAGLETLGFADQHHYFVGLIEAFPALALGDERSRRALRTLLHPELMGTTFRYLVHGKNAPGGPLSGLKYRQALQ